MHNDICPWMHDMLKRNYVYNESQEGRLKPKPGYMPSRGPGPAKVISK